VENRVCLSRGVQVAGVVWCAATMTMAGVGDLVQRTGDGRTGRVLGARTVERSGSAVCGLHLARGDEEREFLGSASKPRSTICEWFGLKTTWTVSSGLALKPAATVLASLASKLVVTVSPGLTSKSAVGFLVEPQNQGGGGFSGLGLKTGSSGLMIWASKSSRLRFVDCATKLTKGGQRGTRVEIY
jgi:hypothetical protein